MSQTDWLTIALGVLPEMPAQVTCLRDDGGKFDMTLVDVRDGELYGTLASLDAAKGLRITIPIEKAERGGYSIGCTLSEIYFLGGLDSGAMMTVDEVLRRKPYRLKERITADSAASIRVVSSQRAGSGSTLVGRLLDISSSGVGMSVETTLEKGDRLQVDTTVQGVRVLGELTVVQASKMAFGRWRIGCQFTHLPLATQHDIDRLASTDAQAAPATQAGMSRGQLFSPTT
jgi:PilZ domain-containing protein